MKILVGITSFGTKYDRYLSQIIDEYRSMSHHVDIVVFSNIQKTFDKSIEVIVGLPSKNPWSLPFAHKRVFAERVDMYDLFIYAENDILIKESNVEAFLRVTSMLPEDKIAGFMLYEDDPVNKKNHVDVHGGFHWDPKSVEIIDGCTFAHFTNEHSACYLLTKEQLRKAIASGGYLTPPREGKYDMLCTAATDPYTQCGFTKVICTSHFEDFALHHLPNAYVGKFGIGEHEFKRQLQALVEVARGERPQTEFFERENKSRQVRRKKLYYEPRDNSVLSLVPPEIKNVLTIGCGSAETEARLVEKGIECVCIPLDSVMGAIAEMKGVRTLPPKIDIAFDCIGAKRFDCILMLNVLQHVDAPLDFIRRCKHLLDPEGIIIGTLPNEDYLQDFFPKRYKTGMGSDLTRYYRLKDILEGVMKIIGSKISRYVSRTSRTDLPTEKELKHWFKRNKMNVSKIHYVKDNLSKKRRRIAIGPLKSLFADKLIFVARKDNY